MQSIIPSVYFMKDVLLTNYNHLTPGQRDKLTILGYTHEYTRHKHSYINDLLDKCPYVMLVNPCDMLHDYQFVFEFVFDIIENLRNLRKLLVWADKDDTVSWSLKGSHSVYGFEYDDGVFDNMLNRGSILARYLTGGLKVRHPNDYEESHDTYEFISNQTLNRNRQHLLTLLAWYKLYNFRGCKSSEKEALYKDLDKDANTKIAGLMALNTPSYTISISGGSGKSIYTNAWNQGVSVSVLHPGQPYSTGVNFDSYIHYISDKRANGYSSNLRVKTLSVVNQRNFMKYYVSKAEYSYMLIQSAVGVFKLIIKLALDSDWNVLPLRISLNMDGPIRTECFLMYPTEFRQSILSAIDKFKQCRRCVNAIDVKDIAFDDVIDEDNQAKLF